MKNVECFKIFKGRSRVENNYFERFFQNITNFTLLKKLKCKEILFSPHTLNTIFNNCANLRNIYIKFVDVLSVKVLADNPNAHKIQKLQIAEHLRFISLQVEEKRRLFETFLKKCGTNLLHLKANIELIDDDLLCIISHHNPNFESLNLYGYHFEHLQRDFTHIYRIAENCPNFPKRLSLNQIKLVDPNELFKPFCDNFYSRIEYLKLDDYYASYKQLGTTKNLDPSKLAYFFTDTNLVESPQKFLEFVTSCPKTRGLQVWQQHFSRFDQHSHRFKFSQNNQILSLL